MSAALVRQAGDARSAGSASAVAVAATAACWAPSRERVDPARFGPDPPDGHPGCRLHPLRTRQQAGRVLTGGADGLQGVVMGPLLTPFGRFDFDL